jgi:N-dimethylarginine dimethylaminohydrolase
MIITKPSEINFSLNDLPSMPIPDSALMVTPEHFTVEYVINPHMEGHIGNIDKAKAMQEWNQVRDAFVKSGVKIHNIKGAEGLPDMVFCANQSLPFIGSDGRKEVLMSIMHADQRKDEVAYIEQWYRQNGYMIHHLDGNAIKDFEGMGDAIWHTGKRLIWGGYGFRSSLDAYRMVNETFGVPVIALELLHPAFYHLDTCFCMLNEDTALIYPGAFTEDGLKLIRAIIPNIIEANQHEAEELFACNATCPDGKNVIIQYGCEKVNEELRNAGFVVHEVSTDEYRKSGGSVFCMKMMVWS